MGVPLLGKMGSLGIYSPEFRESKFYNYFLRMEDCIRLPGKGNWYHHRLRTAAACCADMSVFSSIQEEALPQVLLRRSQGHSFHNHLLHHLRYVEPEDLFLLHNPS